MSQLKEALKTYTETVADTQINLDVIPRQNRPGKEGQKRQAIQNLPQVKSAYSNALKNSLLGMFVTGEKTPEFVAMAQTESSFFVVDLAEFYQQFVDLVLPTLGARAEFGVSQLSAVIQKLREIGTELELSSMPVPKLGHQTSVVPNDKQCYKFVEELLNNSVSVDLLPPYIMNKITKMALEAGVDSGTVPVLIVNMDPQISNQVLAKVFQAGRISTVEAADASKEYVLDTFQKIKDNLKTKKRTKTKEN